MSDTEYPDNDDIRGLSLVRDEDDIDESPGGFFPSRSPVSGLYKWRAPFRVAPIPIPIQPVGPVSTITQDEEIDDRDLEALLSGENADKPFSEESEAALPIFIQKEELRVDVDGRYPQNTASGTLTNGWRQSSHWIARLKPYGRNTWLGWIWYKEPTTVALPYTRIYLKAKSSFYPHQRHVKAIFFGGGAPPRVRDYKFASAYFHRVEFEFDYEKGTTPTLTVDTHDHPNHPASMPQTADLTAEKTYRRAGFQASRSRGANSISSSEAGANGTWSDGEMHDAMQTYWSRFANHPQWALWTLWAKQHDMGPNLGGIMFDDIGPNHRQGTAVFEDSFISDKPAGDPDPAAFAKRMRYWTLIHEMGHAFNLAHSWQKHLGTPWVPLVSNPEDRSFMNYPYNVAGGQAAFFADFEYRFTDQELLFLRHAPGKFVQQGNADWFDDHGFESPEDYQRYAEHSGLSLEIGFNRSTPRFEYLEPVMLEAQIQNNSGQFIALPSGLIKNPDLVTVVVKKKGEPARQWHPYARYLKSQETITLNPGETHVDDLFISAGLNGWDLADPGFYDIQMQIEVGNETLVSNRITIQVEVPRTRQEEILAQDIFTDDAGRVMKFDGSGVLQIGVEAWETLVAKLPDSRAADHARLALALPKTRNYRLLNIKTAPGAAYLDANVAFKTIKADPKTADEMLKAALVKSPQVAADTLGYQDFSAYCTTCADWRTAEGDKEGAIEYAKAQKTAKSRHIHAYPHVRAAAK